MTKNNEEVCSRCKEKIGNCDEIYYPNDKAVCGYCVENKEVELIMGK